MLNWLAGNATTLLVAGDTGNGKSTLARKALESRSIGIGFKVVLLESSSALSLIQSISEFSGTGASSIQEASSLLFESIGDEPRYVVILDNASDWSAVEAIVFRSTKCLITSESLLVPRDVEHDLLRIDPMDIPQSVELIRTFRQSAETGDAVVFAQLLGGRPRLISDVLGMFNEDDLSMRELINILRPESVDIIAQAGDTMSARAVHTLYRRYIESLEDDSPGAALLLGVIAWIGNSKVPMATVESFFLAAPGRFSIDPLLVSKPLISVYLKRLQKRCLVDVKEGLVESHSVTLRIIRDCTPGYRLNFEYLTVERYLRADLIDDFRDPDRHHLSISAIEWFWPMVVILVRGNLKALQGELLNAFVAYAYSAMLQVGDFISLEPLVHRLTSEQDKPWSASALSSIGQLAYEAGIVGRQLQGERILALLESDELESDIVRTEARIFQYLQSGLHQHSKAHTGFVQVIHELVENGWDTNMSMALVRGLEWLGEDEIAILVCEETYKRRTNFVQRLFVISCAIRIATKNGMVETVDSWSDRLYLESPKVKTQIALAYVDECRAWISVSEGNLDAAIAWFGLTANGFESIGFRRRAGLLRLMGWGLQMSVNENSGNDQQGLYWISDESPILEPIRLFYEGISSAYRGLRLATNNYYSAQVTKDDLPSMEQRRLQLKMKFLQVFNTTAVVNDSDLIELAELHASCPNKRDPEYWRRLVALIDKGNYLHFWLY